MMKALVLSGIVVQIKASQFPVAPELKWVDLKGITPSPQVGWSYDGATFMAPAPPPPPPTNDKIYDQVIQNQKVFKGYVLAINAGTIVPGSNMTGAQLKAAVKAKM